MLDLRYIIVLVLFMYWYKASSKGAFILLCGYFVYSLLVFIDIPADSYNYYYSCASFINLVVGYILQKHNKCAAVCSYALVFINIYGSYLWYQYLPPDNYDNISLVVLLIQLITITPRGLLNGLRRDKVHREHALAKPTSFDSFQSHVTMYKIQAEKKA